MERKKASDYPQESLNLFDKYVHGAIDRRAFLDGAQKFAVGCVTATAIWESLRSTTRGPSRFPKTTTVSRLSASPFLRQP
jgi:carboxymethylenebutenolidase